MDFPFEKLKERYEAIPEDVRNAISSVEVSEQLQAIGAKHRLHLDVTDRLFDVTGGVMLGLVHPRDYMRTLMQELNIDADAARAIAQDVNEQIFRPVRESLKTIHGIQGAAPTERREAARDGTAVEKKPAREAAPVSAPQGDVPDGLPVPTDEDEAPEFEKEYPKHTADEDISREEALRDIVLEKLQKPFRLPATKSEFGEEIIKEAITPEAAPEIYKEQDPYREPIE